MESWSATQPPSLPPQSARLELFDSATRSLQDATVTGDQASLYVCGITPYDATHLGHANTYVAFDLLNRFWRSAGKSVVYTQNVTDVDDPLFERAQSTNVDWQQLAEDQTNLFRSDMAQLNVLPPDYYLSVSETVDWVIEIVTQLYELGIAYPVPGDNGDPDGDLYFSIEAAEAACNWRLGSVSGMSLAEMQEVFPERGGDPQRPGKKNPLDPLVWKAAREGEPSWDAAVIGRGRPGWHIECSMIARKTLPAPFDVQAGGSDLRFPHHEFSAAHATAVDHTPMARLYVHAGMVGLDGEKMSKSLGNLVLVSQLTADGHEPAAIRALLLNHHYRTDWSFTTRELTDSADRIAGWRRALAGEATQDGAELLSAIHQALSHDLDAPTALQAVDVWAESAHARGPQPSAHAPTEARPGVAEVMEAVLGIQLITADHPVDAETAQIPGQ
ncbi:MULTISPECIES: cysteine--1-D-myo-inosityl 2-amino-2-deoxy-alpha-D-glucopyranoside ligase [Auritidibacter]|uniref:cysteine--1-D-myo-inosityl 2-amino-2-deoxy-alpha-D-glucopyranoside ligase n=1 Tax=Auritidibacter TaxID=1160973 RepID=UPI000D7370FC|nr:MULTISPECIES: cysteine--1-D-myo-inosityl 2-amino-2-deoxy-alpha-D-glucopyranoside ligase [Auritidibacter]NIH70638.1 L-cysteine:1D-myo-inositol 2-amino-2-deoxy-alpha-D-glucopyranoside ligase [Auritidibacter ignavus]PXA81533.1 cysteine--1-D-myo-inosityl 2-amino-2-deoxy-alpha-D-glucopyranoside ligase [Auritidibacter sp. NML120636]RMX23230.1 cysteine--1-D-myo-inosityl 2-amino-2-deoxy-alpha-D-glucopyranoside ligase [Auritidibacter ignavus]WGH82126.1 cysteine--1-D-myo-inosityl 2-amino-2-deoxy-alpha